MEVMRLGILLSLMVTAVVHIASGRTLNQSHRVHRTSGSLQSDKIGTDSKGPIDPQHKIQKRSANPWAPGSGNPIFPVPLPQPQPQPVPVQPPINCFSCGPQQPTCYYCDSYNYYGGYGGGVIDNLPHFFPDEQIGGGQQITEGSGGSQVDIDEYQGGFGVSSEDIGPSEESEDFDLNLFLE